MDRRQYLAVVSSGLTLGLAGCSGGDDDGSEDNGGDTGTDDSSGGDGGDTGTDDSSGGDGGDTGTDDSSGGDGGDTGTNDSSGGDDGETDDGDENGPEDSNTPAEWLNWLAADTITGGSHIVITRIDLQGVRDHLPDFYAGTGIEQLSSTFGVAEDSLSEMITIDEDNTITETVITGEFSEDSILSAVAESPAEQYLGYNIVRRPDTRELGVSDGAILLSDNVRGLIDAERGETQRVTDADADWNTMLSHLGNSPLAFAETGTPRDSDLTVAPERVTNGYTNIQDVWVDSTRRYQYTSEEAAATAIDSDEEALIGGVTSGRGVLDEIRQEGELVVVDGQVPSETLS